MRHAFPFALFALSLSSCTLIPDYLRPDLPIVNQWMGNDQPNAGFTPEEQAALKLHQQGYTDFFKNPELVQTVELALANNRDLRAAALTITQARAQYRIERADLFPQINGDASYIRQKQNRAIFGGGAVLGQNGTTGQVATASNNGVIFDYYTANVNAAWEIDLFGRIRSLSESALEQYFATEEAQLATRIALIADVANAWLAYQSDLQLLQLTTETLESQEKSYDLIRQTFEAGVNSKLEVSQARQTVETARANLAAYTRQLEQDKNNLTLLVGAPVPPELLKPQKLEDIVLAADLPIGLPSDVLLDRPDILQAEHQLKSANADIGAARANFFPTISLIGSYGTIGGEVGDLFSGPGEIWSVSPGLSLPIFRGGANVATLEATKAERDILIARYEQAIQTAFREVSDALIARDTLDDEYKAQSGLAEATGETYRLSRARYENGIENFLTVLDSQRQLFIAQQNSLMLQARQLQNLVTLYRVVGGGVEAKTVLQPAAPAGNVRIPTTPASDEAPEPKQTL